ncbi:glycosyl transferase [Frankia sp. CcI49]|uniref:glycosyltransferase n=1 Tax=Frankia sp. CcI49 TaxID=1745382 RepID=UPI000978B8A6|nr:nucleotide disphospho-sugar-binding domain-containing protein [Frankia sp. CcI49]ONH56947.1 glycosyl transferase [Frankia sp. CcI49]
MGRILFVVPPLTGHVNPAVGIAGELAARGQQVALVGHSGVVGPLVPPEVSLIALPGEITAEQRGELEARSRSLRGPASLKFLWEEFILPLGDSMARDVTTIIDQWRPDVVVVDQQAVGAALAVRRSEARWVTLATTSAESDDPYAVLAGIGNWVAQQLHQFQVANGVPEPEATRTDLRFSEELTLICSVPSLLRPGGHPSHHVFVGCAAGVRRESPDFPWTWLDSDRRTVLVSLGTVTREAGGRFLRAAAEALLGMSDRVQGVIVAPAGSLDDLAEKAPDDLLVRSFVPQVELMPSLDAVVCHAGNNTVCEALSHGVPLVVAPVRDDQPIIAEQVVRAGAGLRVRFGRSTPATLATAVGAVLDEPSYRAAATRLRDEFTAAGGVVTAAHQIEKLLP